MARSWLEVTTGEVQAKLGDNERLAERRRVVAERVARVAEDIAAPAFEAARAGFPKRDVRQYRDNEWSALRLGLYAEGDVSADPRVAFHEIEFDAYQPLVVLRRKAAGAGALAETRTLRIEQLDRDTLDAFLNDD